MQSNNEKKTNNNKITKMNIKEDETHNNNIANTGLDIKLSQELVRVKKVTCLFFFFFGTNVIYSEAVSSVLYQVLFYSTYFFYIFALN